MAQPSWQRLDEPHPLQHATMSVLAGLVSETKTDLFGDGYAPDHGRLSCDEGRWGCPIRLSMLSRMLHAVLLRPGTSLYLVLVRDSVNVKQIIFINPWGVNELWKQGPRSGLGQPIPPCYQI